jgi:hypothetical protein
MGVKIDKVIVDRLPDFRTFNTAKLGSFSLTSPNIRYIAVEDAVEYNDKIDTTGVHYRDFITDYGIKFPKKNAPSLEFSYPYYAHSAHIPMACYVDIRRAYKQVACAYGMQVWFKEGVSIGMGDDTPQIELFNFDKVARGLLVTGHGKFSKYTLWKHGVLDTVKFENPNYAPYLQYAIWRTLHAIMAKLKPFVYYAHTDGVIANHRMLPAIDAILTRYHFEYAIKDTGKAHIKTTGTYKIGSRETLNYNKHGHKSTDYILSDDRDDWWLKMFANAVEKRPAIDKFNGLWQPNEIILPESKDDE